MVAVVVAAWGGREVLEGGGGRRGDVGVECAVWVVCGVGGVLGRWPRRRNIRGDGGDA